MRNDTAQGLAYGRSDFRRLGGSAHWLRLSVVWASLVLFALGVASIAYAGKRLPDKPEKCQPEGCYGDAPGQMDNTWAGDLSVSPPIVKVGQIVTVTAVAYSGAYGIRISGLGNPIGSCPEIGPVVSCRYKVKAPTSGWGEVEASICNPMGCGIEQESVMVIGKKKGEHLISGRITSIVPPGRTNGVGIRDMTVTVYAKKGSRYVREVATAVTNGDGYYYFKFKAKKGEKRYSIIPTARESDSRIIGINVFDAHEKMVSLKPAGGQAEVNFTVNRLYTLTAGFEDSNGSPVTSLPADGVSQAVLALRGVDPNDDPLKDAKLDMTVNSTASSSPRAIMCHKTSGSRIWPMATSSGPDYAWVVYGSDLKLNSSGELKIDTYFGSEAGTFQVVSNLDGYTDYQVASLAVVPQAAAVFDPVSLAERVYSVTTVPGILGDAIRADAPYAIFGNLSSDDATAARSVAEYFSSQRSGFSGYEVAPLMVDTTAGKNFLVAFYPSGTAVRGADGVSFDNNLALVIADPAQGFDALLDFVFQGGVIGATIESYSTKQLPTFAAWLTSSGSTLNQAVVAFTNKGSALFGGGPYAAGDLASSGRQRSCALE